MNACRKSGNRKEMLLICYICLVCHVFVTHQKNRAVGLLSVAQRADHPTAPFVSVVQRSEPACALYLPT